MLLLSSVAIAIAQDPDPASIQVVAPGETVTAASTSYLLPERYYDACLVKAKQLQVADDALEKCVAEGVQGLEAAEGALRSCEAQLVEDSAEIGKLQAQHDVVLRRQSELYRQRNTAWAVAGGMTLGALTVLALSL